MSSSLEISFPCPECGSTLSVADFENLSVECPSCGCTMRVPSPQIKPGMQFAGFRIERRLGAGGMGEVWLATQMAMDRKVALKILSPDLTSDTGFVSRFGHEIKMAAKLEHPNIVTAHHAGVYKGIHYLAISFIDGVEVVDRLRIDGHMAEAEALRITRAIAEALKYAWNSYGILHRDIKPSNIMLASDGSPKLMDMGISKSVTEETALTMTGAILGTPHYMSPEQAKTESDLDCRADIYSLGATLYHLVTGELPYDAPSAMGVLSRVLTDKLDHPTNYNPDVSVPCAALIYTMTAKKREERQQSWEAVLRDIDHVIKGEMPETVSPSDTDGISIHTEQVFPAGSGEAFQRVRVKFNDGTMPATERVQLPPPSPPDAPSHEPRAPLASSKEAESAAATIVNPVDSKVIPDDAEEPDDGTPGAIVGIDLGTTFSVLALMNESGQVEIIPNVDGYATTPSVVFMDGDTVLVGREAVRAAMLEPDLAAECFKRDLGHTFYSKKISGKDFNPESLSAYILTKLKQDAEEKIGAIKEAVVTVPAYFDDTRRKATQDAGQIAGLKVIDIINEPSAAAIWYAFQNKGKIDPGSIFLVYDLGGGTFDATLMRVISDTEFKTIATDGDVKLGGKDWDKRLLDYVCEQFEEQEGSDPREDPVVVQDIAQRVEEAKRAMSKRSSVNIPVSYGGKQVRVPVSREKFQDLTADLLGRTQTTVELLLDDAGLNWDDIDHILLVGGSSRMVMVSEMLRRVSGKQVDDSLDADLAVAQGAAVHCASLRARKDKTVGLDAAVVKELSEFKHENVNSHSLGIEVENEETGEPQNYIIIPKNTALPCEKSEIFGIATSSHEGAKISVRVLEGESRFPEACVKIGMCHIEGLPAGLTEGSPVKVTFAYSEDGRIHVKAEAVEIGLEATTQIAREHGLNQEEVGKERRILKTMQII